MVGSPIGRRNSRRRACTTLLREMCEYFGLPVPQRIPRAPKPQQPAPEEPIVISSDSSEEEQQEPPPAQQVVEVVDLEQTLDELPDHGGPLSAAVSPCCSWHSRRPLSFSTGYRSRNHCSRHVRWPLRWSQCLSWTGDAGGAARQPRRTSATSAAGDTTATATHWLGVNCICAGYVGRWRAAAAAVILFFHIYIYICI